MPEKPGKVLPALYGGIIMGLISGIPFLNLVNCLCCAGILLGGVMSVFFYKNNLTAAMPPLTSSDGIALGALAGVFGAIVETIIAGLIMMAFGNVARQAMMSLMDSSGIMSQMPPEALENMQRSMEEGGLSVFSVVMSFIVAVIFGLLGGLIGYSIFKSKTPPPMISQPPAQTPVM